MGKCEVRIKNGKVIFNLKRSAGQNGRCVLEQGHGLTVFFVLHRLQYFAMENYCHCCEELHVVVARK
jgi:predicted nucleic acid-binding Zn finger protein